VTRAKLTLTPRERAIGAALERVRASCDTDARRAADPVGIVHRFRDTSDREIVALLAACIAFGNVTTIRAKLDDALARLGPHPARTADDAADTLRRMRGWKHRVFRGEDVARLMIGARALQRESGSLGARFAAELARARDRTVLQGEKEKRRDLVLAIDAWCAAIREAGGLKSDPRRRGPSHLLPGAGPSAKKRLLLFLRWMIRPADGVDLGLWSALVDPSILVVPVDTHIHKLSRNLGFTRRRDVSWTTAEEITAALARYDAADPVKYDFSLCHLGMLQRCPSRKDPIRCEGCGVMPVCRHWRRD
jgi:uncharacterized protein (TIGR02757 family)